MKRTKFLTLVMALAIVAAGCSNAQKGAGIGAGGGAVLGAIIGKIAGNAGVGAAIGGAVGAGAGTLIGKHMDKVKAQAQAVENAQVTSVKDSNGLDAVKVTFDSGILFATNKSDLNQAAMTSLAKFAGVLSSNKDCDVAVYGHTDNTGNDAINNPLSQKRAEAVSSYLRGQGVPNAQIKYVMGKGSTEPVADNATAEGRQQNRRVDVYVYASQAMIDAANQGNLQ